MAMAVSIAQFPPLASTTITFPKSRRSISTLAERRAILSKFPQIASKFTSIPKASAEDENSAGAEEESKEMRELGKEIKQAMKEREEKETGFVSGVVEEIREIEWPAFNKVLGTTGVVLGVIAGSSVVLLTVNAVLAEISDTIFAGKGVQDFFG
ncbi:preprotein translocase subunit SECE1 [Salvia miltiorrhiza]|uniref:preprotein translocase subunit SECE1 n=1 Tax=Salvia miltiorrhiza TaxID=226208 RepID=UPI0025AC58EC|nr:preprotein translocase subunit SECE1 [Salvia miltiorrhiza]